MNMISITTNLDGVTFKRFTNPAKIVEQFRFDCVMHQILSMFCTEYYVDIYFGKRLWHSFIFIRIVLFQSCFFWKQNLTQGGAL